MHCAPKRCTALASAPKRCAALARARCGIRAPDGGVEKFADAIRCVGDIYVEEGGSSELTARESAVQNARLHQLTIESVVRKRLVRRSLRRRPHKQSSSIRGS